MTATTTSISRSITKSVFSRKQSEGVGARVRRSIGRPELRNHDPFLMLDEFTVDKNGGFPDHHYREFETVTYMLEVKSQTHAQGLQRWINLPQEHTMYEPQYQELLDAQILRARPKDEFVVEVIAGESHSLKPQSYTRKPIMYLDFKMSSTQTITRTILETKGRFFHVLNGTAYIGDLGHETEAKAYHALIFSEDGTSTIRIQTKDEEADFVMITGEPSKKPVVQIGQLVINTREEVYHIGIIAMA
ncbi:hypothetical protein KI688_003586 [Linnemannia hyalina]|uniref:Uncharacterized protein n=1 Tax=Linnemannia hyalina TaxID=64524 RepID=A0A9P7XPR4_9FUNG|nr:hypothetical protein KI688_003586 [Linnemannia hyalina]